MPSPRRRLAVPRRPGSSPGLARRDFLIRTGAVGGLALFGGGLLTACGSDDEDAGSGGDGGGKVLNFSNWPAYIDEESVALFKRESGIDLTYTEDYNDNNEYFAKIQPVLGAGERIEPDLITPTYWLVPRLITLDWLDEMPRAAGIENLVDDLETAPLADSPLVFPDEETLANLNVFATLDEEAEAQFDERFSAITGA